MSHHYKEKILSQSLAVRTPVLSEVKQVIDKITPDYSSVKKYNTNIKDWLKPIVDLTEFYVYPTNGITEGLNWWSLNTEYNIWKEPGDYQWVDNTNTKLFPTTVYQSIPSAIDGNFKEIQLNNNVVIDLAYIGSTKIQKIEIPQNVTHAFYSLSKPFGVRNIRTGWYFTRKPDKKLEELTYGAKYYNYYANDVSEAIITNFDIDYIHQKISSLQHEMCNKLDFIPSDSVWLATTTNQEYAKFRRKDNIARICLSGVYEIC